MRRILSTLILSLSLLAVMAACAPRGHSGDEKRDNLREMRDQTLAELYRARPEARDELAKATGYAVFNTSGAQLGLGGAFGYGIAVNNATGAEKFMRMAEGQVGLGLGVKRARYVFIFRKPSTYRSFIAGGWEFGGTAEAGFETEAEGGTASANVKYDADPVVYLVDARGATLAANLNGTKYWGYDELN